MSRTKTCVQVSHDELALLQKWPDWCTRPGELAGEQVKLVNLKLQCSNIFSSFSWACGSNKYIEKLKMLVKTEVL